MRDWLIKALGGTPQVNLGVSIITAEEVRAALLRAGWPPGNVMDFKDRAYRTNDITVLQMFLPHIPVRWLPYEAEYGDCDDHAFLFKAWWYLMFRVSAVGTISGQRPGDPLNHEFSVMFGRDGEVLWVESQNNEEIQAFTGMYSLVESRFQM